VVVRLARRSGIVKLIAGVRVAGLAWVSRDWDEELLEVAELMVG